MDITPEHLRSSYTIYIEHGNSSSATIFSVMDRLRRPDMDGMAPKKTADGKGGVREFVVACAFGPGIAIEMAMLRRNLEKKAPETRAGSETSAETPVTGTPVSERSGSEDADGEAHDDAEKSLSEALNGVELD